MLSKLLGFIGATAGGAMGWWLGSFGGVMASFTISVIGTGIGIYYGRRIAHHYEV